MSDLDEAREMLRLARSDGEALRVLCDNPGITDEVIGFHAQQAAEKGLKAWIAAMGVEYPYTHNIIALLNILEEKGQNVEAFRHLARYNAFAVQFRYPGSEKIPVKLDRRAALADAEVILKDVEAIVEK